MPSEIVVLLSAVLWLELSLTTSRVPLDTEAGEGMGANEEEEKEDKVSPLKEKAKPAKEKKMRSILPAMKPSSKRASERTGFCDEHRRRMVKKRDKQREMRATSVVRGVASKLWSTNK
jgi:hypothetical protein